MPRDGVAGAAVSPGSFLRWRLAAQRPGDSPLPRHERCNAAERTAFRTSRRCAGNHINLTCTPTNTSPRGDSRRCARRNGPTPGHIVRKSPVSWRRPYSSQRLRIKHSAHVRLALVSKPNSGIDCRQSGYGRRMADIGRQHAFTQTAEKLPSRFPPPHRGTFIELVLSASFSHSDAICERRLGGQHETKERVTVATCRIE